MICHLCGVEAPTKYVSFHQNIGALVMRFSKTAEGNLCKSCIHSTFWQFTLINVTLGWWGLISIILTPIFIANNTVRYLLCLGMEPVPPLATVPRLTDDVIDRLRPLTGNLVEQLNSGENFERIADDVAMRAGVTQGQVALYVQALMAASREAR